MRKILMITSTWNIIYIDSLIQGILKRIQDTDIHLHIFNAYHVVDHSVYGQMEQGIFQLPDPREYDGTLVAINSVGDTPYIDRIIASYLRQGCKILSIDQQFMDQPCIGIDNYRMFYQMTEHMITVHGCRTLNYLGGPEPHEENQKRYAAFCDCLARHGIPLDPRRVLHRSFLHADGENAYEHWKQLGLHLPDAVLCANDNMTLGYCVAAQRDGYYAPQNFRISGFDNSEEAQIYSPSITSINRGWVQLGYESVSRLLDMIDGRAEEKMYYTEGYCVFNESCGCSCGSHDNGRILQYMYREKKTTEHLNGLQLHSQQLLCGASIGPGLPDAMNQCCEMLGLGALAIYLQPGLDATADCGDHAAAVPQIYTNRGPDTVTFLVPDSWTASGDYQILLFSPLHFQSENLGYCVVPYDKNLLLYDKHRRFVDNLSTALSLIWQQAKLQQMNLQLQQLYVRDQLTGLYNRFGYEELAKKYFRQQQGRIYMMFLDVDKLKTFNDQYGHAMGDLAIRGVAEAMNAVLTQAPIKVRMGGDEFLAVGPYTDEAVLLSLEARMQLWLAQYSEIHQMPFPLTASMGHVWSESMDSSLEQLVQEADRRMYEIKKARKR